MCRRNQLRGALLLGVGIGILMGYMIDSWLVCCCGGIALLCVGLWIMKQN